MKKTQTKPARTPTPIEDFSSNHWHFLFILEDHQVKGGRGAIAASSDVRADLFAQGFILEDSTLSDRGWEISAAIRRWKADHKNLDDFVAIACGACGRLRYGDRGTSCVCGGDK